MATNNPFSIFPDLPRESPAVTEDGNFSFLWSLGFASLFQALQKNFKNEGVIFPNLPAADIANIQALYAPSIGHTLDINLPDISGQTVFDTDNRVTKQFVITYDTSTPPIVLVAQWNILPYLVLGSGSPTGVQGGTVSWFYYDTANKVLYICTTSGGPGVAVWTTV